MAPMPPFPMEMPRPPPQLDQLTEDELRALEGEQPLDYVSSSGEGQRLS